jgi:tetratricopeptide (TPR) repeat protein
VTEFLITPLHFVRRSLVGRALLLLAFALPLSAVAAAEQKPEDHQISEKVSEGLGKIKPLTDAKNWDAAIALIDELLKVAKTGGTYEEAVLYDIKAKIYLQKPDFPKAIDPMERTLKMSEGKDYFDEPYKIELSRYLTQLYYQEALAPNRAKDLQAQYLAKATDYMKRVIDSAKGHATVEDTMLYAGILYNRAAMNPEKVDLGLIKQAQVAVEGALRSSIAPKKELYDFLAATLSQQSDYIRLAEVLELLVKQNPNSNQYWQQLAAVYLQLGNDDKNKDKSLENNVRAILAMERAQAVGQMKTPKDNYNLASIYLLIGQIEQGCEMLDVGLRNKTIDQDPKTWELLAYYYQQVDKQAKAIDVLKLAGERYPKMGTFDYSAAQIYYSIDKMEDAYKQASAALAKGGLGEKEGAVWQFLAYAAFETGKLDEALAAINKAVTFPAIAKDKGLPQLKKAIEDAINDRKQQAQAVTDHLKQSKK